MKLATQRLVIRPWTETDYASLEQLLTDPVTMQHWPQPFAVADVSRWLERLLDHYQQHGWGRYAVELATTGQVIGDCGVFIATVNNQLVHDFGYIFHHPYWGQGYATEAAQELVAFLFDTIGLHELYANMAHNHYGSQRVAERLGMQRVASFYNPRNRDFLTYVYRLTRS